MRRFGFQQGIPRPCDNVSNLHKCDLRGRHGVDWIERDGEYIQRWAFRHDHIARDQIHTWSSIARLLFDFLLVLGPSMSYW